MGKPGEAARPRRFQAQVRFLFFSAAFVKAAELALRLTLSKCADDAVAA